MYLQRLARVAACAVGVAAAGPASAATFVTFAAIAEAGTRNILSASVGEAAAWVMMVSGAGLAGAALRRRRAAVLAA